MSEFCGLLSIDQRNSDSIVRDMAERFPLLAHVDNFGGHELDDVSLNIAFQLEHESVWISRETESCCIVCGRIYNISQLREELKLPVEFSAPAIVAQSIVNNGWRYTLRYLDGEFSVIYCDRKQFLLSVDRFAGRPLYYSTPRSGEIVFGTGLAVVKACPICDCSIDPLALNLYLHLVAVPAPYTIYTGCHKLAGGEVLLYDFSSRSIRTEYYWDISEELLGKQCSLPYEEAQEQFYSVLQKAVLERVTNTTGVLLSGGYDSTSITALLHRAGRRVNTYTVDFQGYEFNEAKIAAEISKYLQMEHHSVVCGVRDVRNLLEKMPEYYEEPFADTAAIPTMFLAQQAGLEKVPVLLAGDGGDESLGGYADFYAQERRLKYFKSNAFCSELVGNLLLSGAKLVSSRRPRRYLQRIGHALAEGVPPCRSIFEDSEQMSLLNEEWRRPWELSKVRCTDSRLVPWSSLGLLLFFYRYFVPDVWQVKTGRAAMYGGVEIRQPFLSKDYVSFAASLPLSFKLASDGRLKKILRESIASLVPSQLIDHPKQGFAVPVKDWLTGELKSLMLDLLSPAQLKQDGIFRLSGVERLLTSFMRDPSTYEGPMWAILQFQIWLHGRK